MTGVSPFFWKKADTVEIQSFLKQQILRIYYKSSILGLQPLSLGVVDAVVQFYSVGAPVRNHSFHTLVIWLALSIHVAQF